MVCRKSFISYFLWVLYTLSAVAGLFGCISFLCEKNEIQSITGLAASIGILLAEAVACAIFHIIKKNKTDKVQGKTGSGKVSFYPVLAGVIFVGVIVFQTFRIGASPEQNEFYQLAMVKGGGMDAPGFEGSVPYFISLLNIIFWVFGNKINVGYMVNILLLALSALFTYLGVKNIFGNISAIFTLVLYAAITCINGVVPKMNPGSMQAFVFSIGVFAIGRLWKEIYSGIIPYMIAGLICGFAVGIEFSNIVLLVLLSGTAFSKMKDEKASSGKIRRVLLSIIGMIIGLVGHIFLLSEMNGVGPDECFEKWFGYSCLMPERISFSDAALIGNTQFLIVSVFLCLGIFTFFLNDHLCGMDMWIAVHIIFVLLLLFVCGQPRQYAIYTLKIIMAVLSGIAIQNFVGNGNLSVGDNRDMLFNKEKQNNNAYGEKAEADNAPSGGTPGEVVTVNVGGESRKVKLLDNPLKLPKKKEHKGMDYDYEVPEDDDFDI